MKAPVSVEDHIGAIKRDYRARRQLGGLIDVGKVPVLHDRPSEAQRPISRMSLREVTSNPRRGESDEEHGRMISAARERFAHTPVLGSEE